MLLIQKIKYKKFKGREVEGFSHPDRELTGISPKGKIVGYGTNQLIVACENVLGWNIDKLINAEVFWMIPAEETDNLMGFWFIDKYELKEGLIEESIDVIEIDDPEPLDNR